MIGAQGDDDGGSNSGSAYVFTPTAGVWTEQAKLNASDAAAGESFGNSVSVSGDTAVIGAYTDNELGSLSGSAYIFTRTDDVWTEQAKLNASDAANDDQFGIAVSVSGDTALIGAWVDDDGESGSGSAYVFTRTAGVWTEQAKLNASDPARNDHFGRSVSVSGDTAVIGVDADGDAGDLSGSTYVFTRTAGVWTEQAKLTASDAAAVDRFGFSVSVSGDTAVIGALLDDDGGSNSGSAYVFAPLVAAPCLDISIEDRIVSGAEAHETCGDVTLGPNLILNSAADLSINTTSKVIFLNGVEVDPGAKMQIFNEAP